VLEAAQQLADCQHKVKHLKLDAQGIRVADLVVLGDNLVTLPYVTWLTLNLKYTVERRRQPNPLQQQQAAGQGDPGNAAQQAEGQPGQQQPAGAPAAAGGQAAGPAAAGAANAGGAAAAAAAAALAAAAGDGGYFAWRNQINEPAVKLSEQLCEGLPGTVLELRVRPSTLFG